MNKVFISIGSNIEKERNFITCIATLRQTFGTITLSPVYESEAVGFVGNHFYNMVVAFDTALSPQQIHTLLHDIEQQHHRTRGKNKFISRTMDLDQLLHSNLVIASDKIKLPSEEIIQYMHVLYPLADIASDLRHPTLNKTYSELRDAFDKSVAPVKIIPFAEIKAPSHTKISSTA